MPKTKSPATESKKSEDNQICPKCGAPLAPVTETPTGKRLQRCSTGSWNPQTRQTEGCDYVKWLETPPQTLDEKCPKCGNPLLMITTRFGKKAKKCSTSGWDREAKKATGCDYIEWINSSTRQELDEDCPQCGSKLVLVTTNNGKRMKKCSTSGWDRETKQATGCTYIQWLNDNRPSMNNGDENFPSEPL